MQEFSVSSLILLLACFPRKFVDSRPLPMQHSILNISLIFATVRLTTPLAVAALGGVFSERSGVINIALEGMMLTGAFFGVLASHLTQSPWLGVLTAMLSGGLLGLLHVTLTQQLKVDQIVSGMGINILALGLTTYLIRQVFAGGAQLMVPVLPEWRVPLIAEMPILGPTLGRHISLVYVGLGLILLGHVVLWHTPLGLRIRAAGEHPVAALTMGISVRRLRYGCVIASGALGGLAGAYLSIGILNTFNERMTAGKGFIALAAVIFGKWTPLGAAGAALIFGFGEALQITLQGNPIFGHTIPVDFISILPYVLALVVLAGAVGRSTAPAALGKDLDLS